MKTKITLEQLENLYENDESFRRTADNLCNGEFEVDDLSRQDLLVHLRQAYEIYEEEAR